MMALYPGVCSLGSCPLGNNLCATLTSDRLTFAVYPYRQFTTGNVKHRVKIVPVQFAGKSNAIA